MLTHMKEAVHSQRGAQILVLEPLARGEALVKLDGEEVWLPVDQLTDTHERVLQLVHRAIAARMDDLGNILVPATPAVFEPRGRLVLCEVEDGGQRMVRLLPSPQDPEDAVPLFVPYDQAMLDDRKDRWPNVRLPEA